jgi:hypothetical protein
MSRMEYDYKEYMCITIPKQNAVFWCDDDKLAIYVYQTRFFIVDQASPDFYIVSNAQYKNSRDDERMLTINTVASLNSFVNSNSPLFLKFKNKDTFMVHLSDA